MRGTIMSSNTPAKRLYRTTDDKMIAGVCGGLARYFNMDPTLVRVVVALLVLLTLGFPGVIGYIVLVFVMPEQPAALDAREEPGFVPAADPGPPPVFRPEENADYSRSDDNDSNQAPAPAGSGNLWANAKSTTAGDATEPDQR